MKVFRTPVPKLNSVRVIRNADFKEDVHKRDEGGRFTTGGGGGGKKAPEKKAPSKSEPESRQPVPRSVKRVRLEKGDLDKAADWIRSLEPKKAPKEKTEKTRTPEEQKGIDEIRKIALEPEPGGGPSPYAMPPARERRKDVAVHPRTKPPQAPADPGFEKAVADHMKSVQIPDGKGGHRFMTEEEARADLMQYRSPSAKGYLPDPRSRGRFTKEEIPPLSQADLKKIGQRLRTPQDDPEAASEDEADEVREYEREGL